jgi:hypothetical protein
LKTEKFISEVMPDGNLSLPEKVAKDLDLEPYARVRVIKESPCHKRIRC